MIISPSRKIAFPYSRQIDMPWRDRRMMPTLNMAMSNAEVTKAGPMRTKWGNLRRSSSIVGGFFDIRLDGSCPLTMQVAFSGMTQCPGCIQISAPSPICALSWDGTPTDLNQTVCCKRSKCDCFGCSWSGFFGASPTDIVNKYSSPCDCTGTPFSPEQGFIGVNVSYDRIAKKMTIGMLVGSVSIGISTGVQIFSATVDAMNCKDPVMSISNDYTGCFSYSSTSMLLPVPELPNSIAYGGTATVTPGGCSGSDFSDGFSSGFS